MRLPDHWNERLAALVNEAADLRWSVDMPDSGDLTTLHEALTRTRRAQDRVEQIMADLIVLDSEADQASSDARADQDDAWNQQALTFKNVGSDLAPRERYARYATATVEQQILARRTERRRRDVRTSLELVRLFHKGLEGIRWSLDGRVRAMTVDTKLER